MTRDNKFSFIRNTAPIHETSSPKKERSSCKRQINPRKQRKTEAIAIYPDIYLHEHAEQPPSTTAESSTSPVLAVDADTDIDVEANIEIGANVEGEADPEQEQKSLPIEEIPSYPQKIGRPRGRRSNPDYEQVTAYIRRETYTAIKIALLQKGKTRGFSELVEELLTAHLQNS